MSCPRVFASAHPLKLHYRYHQPSKHCKQYTSRAIQTSIHPDSTRAKLSPGALFPSSRIPASCRAHNRSGQPATSEDQGQTVIRSVAARHWLLDPPKTVLISHPAHYASSCLSIFDQGPARTGTRGFLESASHPKSDRAARKTSHWGTNHDARTSSISRKSAVCTTRHLRLVLRADQGTAAQLAQH